MTNEPWWDFLELPQKELIRQSFYLLDWAKKNQDKLHDYSFLVMPAAKAFEGYLKKLLYTLQLISEEDYNKDRFRLGKALNPELERRLPEECLYNEIARICQPKLAEELWQTWKKGRNRLLHYFPGTQHIFSLSECEKRLNLIIQTIGNSFADCKIKEHWYG